MQHEPGRRLPRPRLADLRRHYPAALCLFAVVAFAYVSLRGLLTWPMYYEDESWSYVATFETLRGNLFSWGAFGEGRAIFAVAAALPLPFVALSPWGPEETVRLFSLLCGVVFLAGVFVLAKRLAPRAAWFAPLVLVATPLMFTVMRYGRTDVEALALAAWALVAAAHRRPLVAGMLSGLALSVHPVYAWLGAPCLALAWQAGRRDALRYLAGGVVGVLPQALWVLANLESSREIWDRYAITANTAAFPLGTLQSMWEEPQRFRAYVELLSSWQKLFQLLTYVVLPVAGLVMAVRRKSWLPMALLVAAPSIFVAATIDTKSAFYTQFVLMPLAVVAAYAVSQMPGAGRAVVAGVAMLAVTVVSLDRLEHANASRGLPTAREAVEALSRELPRDSVVVIPNVYAGLLQTRPDVRVFNYHGLSFHPEWRLPDCSELDDRLRTLQRDDSRGSPERRDVSEVYFVTYPLFLDYLKSIYVDATDAQLECMIGAPGTKTQHFEMCDAQGKRCAGIDVTRHPLR
jgi:hypothetical protein